MPTLVDHRAFLEAIPDAVFLLNPQGTIQDCNNAARRLYGYTRDELRARRISDLVTEKSRDVLPALPPKKQPVYDTPVEVRAKRKDTSTFTALLNVRYVATEHWEGNVVYVRDISRRKEAETRYHQTLERINRQYQALITLSTQAGLSQKSLEETLPLFIEKAVTTLQLDRATIWRRRSSTQCLCCLAAYGEEAETLAGRCLPLDSITSYLDLMASKGAVAVDEVYTDQGPRLWEEGFHPTKTPGATLDVPIRAHGEVIGLMSCEMLSERRNWTPETITFATHIADLAAQAFLNADVHRRARELTAITQISREVSAVLDLKTLGNLMAEHATEILEADAGGVFIVTPDDKLSLATYGLDKKQHQTLADIDVFHDTDPIIEKMLEERQPLQIHDINEAPATPLIQSLKALNCRSLLLVHMFKGDQQIGGIGISNYTPRRFTQEEISFLEALAQQCVNAVQHARLLYREQQRRELAEALEQAAILVNSNLHPDEVLDSILEQVARVVTGDTFNIMLISEDQAYIERWRGYGSQEDKPDRASIPMRLSEYPILQKMIRTGDPVVIPNTLQAPDWIVDTESEWRHSYVGAPIRISGETVGFLNVNATQAYQFNTSDGERLKAFAAHAATAIHNARLFQKLREYADELEERVEARTAELRAQYARLEAVLNSTTDGFIVTDAEGQILQENPVANIWRTQILIPDEAQKLEETLKELAQNAEQHPDAVLELTDLDLQLRAAPVHGNNDGAGTRVVAVHDVSHLKELERMKSQFISNVSHELRTPVTTIKLYAQLLRQCPPEKQTQYLTALESEANRQAQLIQDILQFSKMGTIGMALDRRPTNLNPLVKSLIQAQEIRAKNKDIKIDTTLGEELPLVNVDDDKVKQVFLNLIINAIQYTPNGGEVHITTDVTEIDEQRLVIVQISDTGIGIPSEELPYIFQRFFRGSLPQQKQISGTGLGLAIAKEIIDLHDGWITVESEINQGSTFTVWLPTAEENEQISPPSPQEAPSQSSKC